MLIVKTSLHDEFSEFFKSYYISRTGVAGHYKCKYYEPDGIYHGAMEKR